MHLLFYLLSYLTNHSSEGDEASHRHPDQEGLAILMLPLLIMAVALPTTALVVLALAEMTTASPIEVSEVEVLNPSVSANSEFRNKIMIYHPTSWLLASFLSSLILSFPGLD